jgi:hypothetical protein
VVLMFSWVQQDNLIWAFQSQFFLAQWVPLVALYLLARALPESPASARWFAAACAAGVASVGTMASGILALPLMTAYALLVRMPWRRVGMLAGLSVLCLAAYFHGYETPGGHGSARDLVTREPALLAQYVLLYLGSPVWYALVRWTDDAAFVAQVAGALLLVFTGVRAATVLRSPRAHGVSLAMLFFVGYILATALGTAAGRLVFGLIQATSSRYTTPALMAWLALLAAWLPVLMGRQGRARAGLVLALLVVLVPLTKFQFQAQKDRGDILFQRELAALAVEMRVRDDEQIAHVIYKTDVALDVAARMAAHPAGAWTQP